MVSWWESFDEFHVGQCSNLASLAKMILKLRRPEIWGSRCKPEIWDSRLGGPTLSNIWTPVLAIAIAGQLLSPRLRRFARRRDNNTNCCTQQTLLLCPSVERKIGLWELAVPHMCLSPKHGSTPDKRKSCNASPQLMSCRNPSLMWFEVAGPHFSDS